MFAVRARGCLIATAVLLCGCEDSRHVETTNPEVKPVSTKAPGALAARGQLLQRWADLNHAVIAGTPITSLPTRTVQPPATLLGVEPLTTLLPDQPFRVSFDKSQDGKPQITELWIGSAPLQVTAAAPENLARTTELANTVAEVELASAQDRQRLLDDTELNPSGIELLDAILTTSASAEARLAAVQRLDLGEEYGAKGLLLDALDDSDDNVASAALDSVERWQDVSTLNHVQRLEDHPNPGIAERAAQLAENLLASTGYKTGELIDPAQSSHFDLQQATRNARRMDQKLRDHMDRARDF